MWISVGLLATISLSLVAANPVIYVAAMGLNALHGQLTHPTYPVAIQHVLQLGQN